jgi:Mg-chelatase subunit ChlD
VKKFSKTQIQQSLLVIILILLAACGGSLDEAVEDTSETDTSSVEDTTDSESISDDGVSATGSEEDSGELPPTPNSDGKADTVRATPNVLTSVDTVVTLPAPPANRIDSGQASTSRQLDVVLLLDATGSMADELDILKAGLGDVAAALSSLAGDNTIRYGFVVYRDQEKSGSDQLFEFTDNWVLFAENLMTITAVGGGDYPENLNGGFSQAITLMNWNPEAKHLLILLGDAPPHQDTVEPTPYDEKIVLAAEQNIIVFTIGSDGLNNSGANIYQQIAQASNGRFIFMSNNPENAQINTASIQPTTDLPAILVDIVLEVLNQEMP